MFRRFFLLIALVFSAVVFTSCGGGVDFSSQASDRGFPLESFLPEDIGMLVSYSLRNTDQYDAVQSIEEKLGDAGRLSRTFSDQFDASFKDLGLDFQRDLQPAFGDQFRFVYATRLLGSNTEVTSPDVFTVISLKDPTRLQSVFQVLVDAGNVEEKVVDGTSVYVNNERAFYATIHEDLLLFANTADHLIGMVEQDEKASLWDSQEYQEALENVGDAHVLYGVLFPSRSSGEVSPLLDAFNLNDIPSVIARQTFVARAETGGLRFELFVKADKEKAKKVDISLDQVPHAAPYLFREVPAEQILAYFESYGLKQTLDLATTLGGDEGALDSLRATVRSYLGMDLDEDVLSFLDQGYALSFHTNGLGVFPGVSIFVDVGSAPDSAQSFVDKVDGQLSGLIAVFEASLPGAFTKETVDVGGFELTRIRMDLSAVPRSEDSPLPTSVTESPIELIYGLMDDRLLISTATVWGESFESTVADSPLYKNLSERVDNVDEGLILFDAQGLAGFAAQLRALREQLGLQVSQEALTLEEFLNGFEGAIAQSHANAYDSVFGGYLELAQ